MAMSKFQAVFNQANNLHARHEHYNQYAQQTNDMLYGLLGDIQQFAESIISNKDVEKVIKEMRAVLKSEYNIRTTKKSSAVSIAVRSVLRTSRKTAHVYTRVIETAIAEGIAHTALPDFIKRRGGIDAIRKSTVDAETKKRMAAEASREFKAVTSHLSHSNAIATVQSPSASSIAGLIAADVSLTYLACTRSSTGELSVVAAIYPSATVEQQAYQSYSAALAAAAISDKGAKFSEYCKERGLNMDLVHRFMQANSISSAADARALIKSMRDTIVT